METEPLKNVQHPDQFDIIDVLSFLWKARLVITYCLILGVCMGLGWYKYSQYQARTIQTFSFLSNTTAGSATSYTQVSKLLKTEKVQKIFFKELRKEMQANGLKLGPKELNQIGPNNIILSISEMPSSELSMEIRIPRHWSSETVKKSIMVALNAVVSFSNTSLLTTYDAYQKEAYFFRAKLAETAYRARKLALNSENKKVINEDFMKENQVLESDKVLLFIAAIPGDDPAKQELTQNFYDLQMKIDRTNHEIAELRDVFKIARIFPVNTFDVAQYDSDAEPDDIGAKSLVFLVMSGSIIGVMFGMMSFALVHFIQANRSRLHSIFN